MQAIATTWLVAIAAASLPVLLVFGVVFALVRETRRPGGHSTISIYAKLKGCAEVRLGGPSDQTEASIAQHTDEDPCFHPPKRGLRDTSGTGCAL
jgi:hypothetical protein